MELEGLTEQVIGAAIRVHRELGPGFLESIYENALVVELRASGIKVEQQVRVPIIYQETEVGTHVLDLFVADELVVELKVVKELEPVHFAIVRSYLRAMNRQHGLLLNFAKTRLEPKRVIANRSSHRIMNSKRLQRHRSRHGEVLLRRFRNEKDEVLN